MPFQKARLLLRQREGGALALPAKMALNFYVDVKCFGRTDQLNVRGTRLVQALYSAESRYPYEIYGPLVIVDDHQSLTPQLREELWNLCPSE